MVIQSQIPGVYPKGAAYSKKELQAIAATQYIPIRDVDAKALENVMRYADTLGLTFEDAVDRLSAQPALAVSFFNVKAPKGKAVTSTESLIAEINDKFQNTLDVNVPGDIAKKYASEIQASQRADRPLSAQERENILLKYLENAADDLAKQAGDAEFQPRGVLGEYITDLRREYFENGLPIDENRIYRMAVKSLRDPQELESNKQRIRQRAELVFPPLKEYIEKIFEGTTYSLNCDFFDTAFFKTLIIPNNSQGIRGTNDRFILGTKTISQVLLNSNTPTARSANVGFDTTVLLNVTENAGKSIFTYTDGTKTVRTIASVTGVYQTDSASSITATLYIAGVAVQAFTQNTFSANNLSLKYATSSIAVYCKPGNVSILVVWSLPRTGMKKSSQVTKERCHQNDSLASSVLLFCLAQWLINTPIEPNGISRIQYNRLA